MPSSSLVLRSSTTFLYCLSLLTVPVRAATSTEASATKSTPTSPITSSRTSTTASATPSPTYTLDTSYSGNNFFNNFDFFTDSDPTHGFVQYLDQADAQNQGLISVGNDGSVFIGVDSTNVYNVTVSVGRPSVRITSQKKFNHGLFLADIANMPGGVCGTWPALWTLGDGTWPYHGEIDILEGANDNTNDLSSLHVAGQCSIAGTSETGYLQTSNCTYDVTTGANSVGCGVGNSDTRGYGLGFNSNGGGVYAMEWTSSYIHIFFFPRGSIPVDIQAGTPNPSLWGTPVANMQGACDIDSNFQNHQIVLDTTFCGDWAANTWSSCAASTGVSTCTAYVANYPGAFTNMYWDIKSIQVFQARNTDNSSTTSSTSAISTSTTITSPTNSVTSFSVSSTISNTTSTSSPTNSVTSFSVSSTISNTTSTSSPTNSIASFSISSTTSNTNSTGAPTSSTTSFSNSSTTSSATSTSSQTYSTTISSTSASTSTAISSSLPSTSTVINTSTTLSSSTPIPSSSSLVTTTSGKVSSSSTIASSRSLGTTSTSKSSSIATSSSKSSSVLTTSSKSSSIVTSSSKSSSIVPKTSSTTLKTSTSTIKTSSTTPKTSTTTPKTSTTLKTSTSKRF